MKECKLFVYILNLSILFYFPISIWSQNPWSQIAYLPDTTIHVQSIDFSIGDYGYIVGGMQLGAPPWGVKNDFWKYNPLSDSWEQLIDFPRSISCGAGFVVDSIIYVTTGHDSLETDEIDSLYAWYPDWDHWVNLGAIPPDLRRTRAVGFSINGRGYITTGLSVSQIGYLEDLWEYNPSSNSWVEKSSFPGVSRYDAICFVVDNCAYIGLGSPLGSGGDCTELWEYNSILDTWTQKASFIYPGVTGTTAFSVGNKGYVTLGHSLDPPYTFFNAIWEYDPVIDEWQQLNRFPGMIRAYASDFVINDIGYIVGGTFLYLPLNLDNWSFNPTLVSVDPKHMKNYSIFPNPCSSTIKIQIPSNIDGPYAIQIFNMMNASVLKTSSIHVNLNNTIELNLRELSNGIYYVIIQNNNGEVLIKDKILKWNPII